MTRRDSFQHNRKARAVQVLRARMTRESRLHHGHPAVVTSLPYHWYVPFNTNFTTFCECYSQRSVVAPTQGWRQDLDVTRAGAPLLGLLKRQ